MTFVSSATRPATIDLTELGVSNTLLDWAKERFGCVTPTTTQLDNVEFDSRASSTDRHHMQRLRAAMFAPPRSGGSATIARQKPAPNQVLFEHASPRELSGEPEPVKRVRDGVQSSLWKEHTEACARLAKDLQSDARLIVPVLACFGRPGHGQEQLLATLAPLLSDGPVHVVPLAGVTNADASKLCNDDGPLSAATLGKLAPGSIIHLKGAANVVTNAPKVAERVQEILVRQYTAGEKRPCVVVDLPAPTGTETHADVMSAAFGSVMGRVVSAKTDFNALGAERMRELGKARLSELLAAKSLANVQLFFETDAWSYFGEALVTSDVPLHHDQLDQRLLRLVATHMDTQTSIDRERALDLVVTMNPGLDTPERDAILANLQSPRADLLEAERLFLPLLQAQSASPDEREALEDLVMQTFELAGDAATRALPEQRPQLDALVECLAQLAGKVAVRRSQNRFVLLSVAEHMELCKAADALGATTIEAPMNPDDNVTRGLDLLRGIETRLRALP